MQEANVGGIVVQDALLLNDAWVVDLGASFHATPHRKYFQDYVQGDFGYVYLGDDKTCKVIRKGKVLIKLQDRNELREAV